MKDKVITKLYEKLKDVNKIKYSYAMMVAEVGENFKGRIPENLKFSLKQLRTEASRYKRGALSNYVNAGGNLEDLVMNEEALANVRYNDKFRTKNYKLGNVEEGDGYKYRGRGLIQLTGRNNYKYIGKLIGKDLENNPDLLHDEDINIEASIAYLLQNKKFMDAADKGDILAMRKAVNGGTNGLNRFNNFLRDKSKTLESRINSLIGRKEPTVNEERKIKQSIIGEKRSINKPQFVIQEGSIVTKELINSMKSNSLEKIITENGKIKFVFGGK